MFMKNDRKRHAGQAISHRQEHKENKEVVGCQNGVQGLLGMLRKDLDSLNTYFLPLFCHLVILVMRLYSNNQYLVPANSLLALKCL